MENPYQIIHAMEKKKRGRVSDSRIDIGVSGVE